MSALEMPANISTLVLTDFFKAFDMVDHTIAFEKLLQMNVPPEIVQWIVGFISQRSQRVIYKGALSEWATLTVGVPQGTLLAVLIFLIYVNDSLQNVENMGADAWKYVDDQTIGETSKFGEPGNLQAVLDNLYNWTKSNKLKLNLSKCQGIRFYFGRRPLPDISLHISNENLPVVNSVKLLGVVFDNDLKWSSNTDAIIAKANCKLFILWSLRRAGFNCDELLTIYRSHVRPVLEYAAPLWHPGLTKQQSMAIERIQTRVCRCILADKFISYSDALSKLGETF
ncbi:uncharacterized protein LOC117110472 [Anneissia japonica]|uniref:uncharacterized protein LOC117110472 n=1 Tax=Anneissia japonica TaxID=1529436 RepID=UPI001425551A|nr:uncharacterized protein LOC117110472 [Anneissia japonica]